MNLTQVLQLVAAQIKADAGQLVAYAYEYTGGGYDINPVNSKWPQGSLWGVEAQILYALVRHLKPEKVVEIGGWAGASAAALASAVKANGHGQVVSVDNQVGAMEHGSLFPVELQPYATLVRANGEDWLAAQPDHSIGLIFEDATHEAELVALLSSLALRKLVPGGLLVNHDAAHDFAYVGGGQRVNSDVGLAVRNGLAKANAYFTPYLAEPSDCGVAITVAPGISQKPEPEDMIGIDETLEGFPVHAGFAPSVGIAPIESALPYDSDGQEPSVDPQAPAETISEPPPDKPKAKRGRKPKAK